MPATGAPLMNGKVERSQSIDDEEFYQMLDQGGMLFRRVMLAWVLKEYVD